MSATTSGNAMPEIKGSELFGEYYYAHDCGLVYERNEHWVRFFGGVADGIIREFQPERVLDVGCAKGFLVEALRARGVEAWGIDVSEYAISEVHGSVSQYCRVSSAANPVLPEGFPTSFDLVTCIEVIEHMEVEDTHATIENFARWGGRLLFSSSPEDFSEATHITVRPPDYWAARLATHRMWHNLDLDASFLTPWAAVFDRRDLTPPELVAQYERHHMRARREIRALRAAAVESHMQSAAASGAGANDAGAPQPLDEELAATRSELAAVQAELDQLRSESDAAAAELTKQLDAASLAVLAARDECVGAEAQAGNYRARILELEVACQRNVHLAQELNAEVGRIAEHRDGLLAVAAHREAMLQSTSWKIGQFFTRPMRLLRRAR